MKTVYRTIALVVALGFAAVLGAEPLASRHGLQSFPPATCSDGNVITYVAAQHGYICSAIGSGAAGGVSLVNGTAPVASSCSGGTCTVSVPSGGTFDLGTLKIGGITAMKSDGTGTINSAAYKLAGSFVMAPAGTAATLLSGTERTPQGAGLYGDGSDGDCAFDGSTVVAGVTPAANVYTLTRTLFCSTGAIANGVTVVGKYPIYFSVSSDFAGTANINSDGNAGGLNGVAGPAITDGYMGDPNGSGTRGSPAQAGGLGTATGGVAAGATSPVCHGQHTGGTGGNGGSGTGGAGSALAELTPMYIDCRDWRSARFGYNAKLGTGFWTGAGGGGGAGTNVGGGQGGGGGGGGASVQVYSRLITGSGTHIVHADGGAGGPGNNTTGCTTGPNGCGGGGGGSGGYLILIYGSYTGTGCTMTAGSCYSVSGGAGGIHTGVAGTDGGAGGTGIAVVQQGN